jgi:hypothetical protein
MNLQRYWHRKKEKLRKMYPYITRKDLNCHVGEEKKMIENLGSKTRKTQKELLSLIITL